VPREVTTDLSILGRLVSIAGRDVVDIGCGGGALVRELAAGGARVTGLEISKGQLAAALAHDGAGSARYLVGRAQELPFPDGSQDVVVFMRTLHHVPPPDLGAALREARRVLRPAGAVYVAEPLTEGDYFELTSLVEDEREVREAAQGGLADAVGAGLERATTVDYDVRVRIADVAAYRARVVSVDPARAEIFDSRRAEIAEAFARLGEPGETTEERWFVQPMRADVLRPARGALDLHRIR
jgi:SAM-dependent methyltransferase